MKPPNKEITRQSRCKSYPHADDLVTCYAIFKAVLFETMKSERQIGVPKKKPLEPWSPEIFTVELEPETCLFFEPGRKC